MPVETKKIRVVVEVTIPATTRISERHLQAAVMQLIPAKIRLLTKLYPTRVKVFNKFWPMFLRKERGLNNFEPKETTDG